MLTCQNKKYYTKDEIINNLILQKSKDYVYLKHTYNIIISRIHNSKQKYYCIQDDEDIFLKFRQNEIKEIEKQYIRFFIAT